MRVVRMLVPLGGAAIALVAAAAASGAADRVLATVGGEEITSAQVRLESGNAPEGSPRSKAVLQALIDRKLLVAEAEKRELDETPMGAMLLRRADDIAVTELLTSKLLGPAPAVSDAEVSAFINAHPTMFAQRRLIALNQFVVDKSDSKLVEQLKPLDTMAQFEEVLLRDNLQYSRTAAILDTMNVDPTAAAQIGELAVGAVFIRPRGGTVLELSEITENRLAPISGVAAQQIAREILVRQQTAERLRTAVEGIVARGQAQVRINADYAPKPAASEKAKS
jgi:EpsD family peptidyl-prolyl cis-trans isomerase